MHSFQRSVAVLPFRYFRSCCGRCARERNCWKRISVVPLCKSDQNADWSSSNGRTAKIGFDPICYGTAFTAVTAQRQVGTATAQRIICYVGIRQRNSYGAYGILTEFV